MQIVDVDFRWVVPPHTTTERPKLQFRKLIEWSENSDYSNERWDDWQDVRTEEE
jgi:hypothetical protein